MKRRNIILTLIFLFILIWVLNSESHAAFYIQNFEINSEVLNNGDMKVEENITYYSTESKNGVTREIQIKNDINETNSANGLILESVRVDGNQARKVNYGVNGSNGIYEYEKSGDTHDLKVYATFSGVQTRTISYTYLLKDVGVRYNDTSEIFWNFIGDEWDTKISNVQINIKLPEQAAQGTIYVFGHGSDNGTFTKNANYITLNAMNLQANQAIDARILFPTQALVNNSKVVNKTVLQKYINEEEGLSKDREQPEIILGLDVKEIAILLTIIVVLAWILIYFKYDKEISVQKHYYYRDIPHDLEPEILQRIYYGKKCKDSFWITFLNLVKKGVYKIEETTNEVGRKVKIIRYNGIKGVQLKEYQKSLIDMMNQFFVNGKETISIEELNAKMKNASSKGYKKFLDKFNEQMQSYFGDSSKTSKKPFYICVILMIIMIAIIGLVAIKISGEMAIMIIMFLLITTLVYSSFFSSMSWNLFTILFLGIHFSAFEAGIITMMASSGIGLLYIPYIILFVLLQYTQRIKKLCKEENEIREQIKGLRRYLRDYSKIQDRELSSIVIWEDYLIIAIALKLNKRTVNYFYDYCSSNLNNEFGNSLNSFGTYYYMDTIARSAFNNYARSYTSSSSYSSGGSSFSGASGGFSGGSSSGGRGRRRWRRKLLLKKRDLGPGFISLLLYISIKNTNKKGR